MRTKLGATTLLMFFLTTAGTGIIAVYLGLFAHHGFDVVGKVTSVAVVTIGTVNVFEFFFFFVFGAHNFFLKWR